MATQKQTRAAKNAVKNGGNVSKAMRDAGYSPKTAKTPKKLTKSKGWEELMDDFLPDEDLLKTNKQLLHTTRIEHMVFPLYTDPSAEVEKPAPEELEPQAHGGALMRRHAVTEGSSLSDKDIEEMLAEVNCKVRKIVHGETARHVYFWAADAMAQKAALELAYKLKGKLTLKINANLNGNLNVALVEFVGDDPADSENKGTVPEGV